MQLASCRPPVADNSATHIGEIKNGGSCTTTFPFACVALKGISTLFYKDIGLLGHGIHTSYSINLELCIIFIHLQSCDEQMDTLLEVTVAVVVMVVVITLYSYTHINISMTEKILFKFHLNFNLRTC